MLFATVSVRFTISVIRTLFFNASNCSNFSHLFQLYRRSGCINVCFTIASFSMVSIMFFNNNYNDFELPML